jgi:endogenous inhibitor of DNA gyrase (YacG/DUF329 family)
LYNDRVSGPTSCVYCRRRPVDPAWRPFCSERCRLLDLSGWIDGSYRVPGEPAAADDDDDALDDSGEEKKE